jgi:hypothetical protein
MPINAATPKVGSTTYVEPSDGTADVLSRLGATLAEARATFDADTEYLTQKSIDFSVTEPRVNPSLPNGYTQQKRIAKLKIPLELDNGNRTVNTVTITMSCDIETSAAERTELMMLGSQLLGDSDFTDFWQSGDLS